MTTAKNGTTFNHDTRMFAKEYMEVLGNINTEMAAKRKLEAEMKYFLVDNQLTEYLTVNFKKVISDINRGRL